MTHVSYEHIPINECGEPLVDLADYPFVLQPVYYQQGLSSTPRMFVRHSIAEKLLAVTEKLRGNQLKIWDAWRPRSVQNNVYQKYWRELQAQNPQWTSSMLRKEVGTFVTLATSPHKIPPHATGGTVDLTVVDASRDELNMGTEFDHFGPESASYFFENTENALHSHIGENRRLLRNAMHSEGFRIDDEEWWHFDFGNQLWAHGQDKLFAQYGEVADFCGLPAMIAANIAGNPQKSETQNGDAQRS